MSVHELAARARHHPLWAQLRSVEAVVTFMEHHVWAVWDFMSLLKSIQAEVAPARVPWTPAPDADAARLVNEIMVGEEGDDGPDGVASHFDIYLAAMDQAGADTAPVRAFVAAVAAGQPWERALQARAIPAAGREFVATTLAVCAGSLAERVAAFTLGREELIPGMFAAIARDLPDRDRLGRFVWYLERHVAIDSERHGPMSAALFDRVCRADPAVLAASFGAARRTLLARVALWDAALHALPGAGRYRLAASGQADVPPAPQ